MVAIIIVIVVAAIATAAKHLLEGALGGLSYGPPLSKIVAAFVIGLGVLIVGVGGGLIAPMRSRWEGWLTQLAVDTQAPRPPRTANRPGAGSPAQSGPGAASGQPYA